MQHRVLVWVTLVGMPLLVVHGAHAATAPPEVTSNTEWIGEKVVTGNVFIPSGVTMTIKKGSRVTFQSRSRIDIQGKLVVEGTFKEPVVLQKDAGTPGSSFVLAVSEGGELVMRNADVSGGGEAALGGEFDTTAPSSGAVEWEGGSLLSIDHTRFHDNITAISFLFGVTDQSRISVHRSQFLDNRTDVYVDAGAGTGTYDFRYNWWGSADGPERFCEGCSFRKVSNKISVSDWARSADTRDPVILIPGIVGSYEVLYATDGATDPVFELDPIFHTYDDLYLAFVESGYTPEVDLFKFPYDWISSDNVANAVLLRDRIREITKTSRWPKIDIVAHSMGGLLARQYIESSDYQDDVDQLITLGTPHQGAPESYLRWEGAKWFLGIKDSVMEFLFNQWAEHSGYDDIFDFMHDKPILSVKQLLPIYDYLFRWDGEKYIPTKYSDGYPRNEFLETLSQPDRLEELNNIEFTNIIGSLGDDASTITGFNVIDADRGKLWVHGFPNNIDSILGEDGVLEGNGDATVPEQSAKSISSLAQYEIVLDSSHNDLPTDAQKDILELLTRTRPATEVRRGLFKKMLTVIPHSPIHVLVISPSGKRVGIDPGTGTVYREAPGSFASGSGTINEFVTIPNPEEGEYRIVATGTGSGEYRIRVAYLSEDEQTREVQTSQEFLTGTATDSSRSEVIARLHAGEIALPMIDSLPPITAATITGQAGSSGWYWGDVSIALSSRDNEGGSGVNRIEYSLNRGETWEKYGFPILFSSEGAHEMRFRAIDRAGNSVAEQTVLIKIDKKVPEIEMTFNPKTKELDVLGIDTVDQDMVPTTQYSTLKGESERGFRGVLDRWRGRTSQIATVSVTDDAGHKSVFVYEIKKASRGIIHIEPQSLEYDGVKTSLDSVRVRYKWVADWQGRFRVFATSLRTTERVLESHYRYSKNETVFMEKPRDIADDGDDDADRRRTKMVLPGMVIPTLISESGMLRVDY